VRHFIYNKIGICSCEFNSIDRNIALYKQKLRFKSSYTLLIHFKSEILTTILFDKKKTHYTISIFLWENINNNVKILTYTLLINKK
jgi:hypothetical protein